MIFRVVDMRFVRAVVVLLCVLAYGSFAQGESPSAVVFTDEELNAILGMSPLPEPPSDRTNSVADNPAAARLGQFLFFDKRLSEDGDVSCATCHVPDRGFTDHKPVAETIARSNRNTPGLWNLAYQRWYFWDGRADTMWSQALQPIENPIEMNGNRLRVAHLIRNDAKLKQAYENLFGSLPDMSDSSRFPSDGRPVPTDAKHAHHKAWASMSDGDREIVDRVFANVGKVIAAYERKLISNDSPFDYFVEGLRTRDAEKLQAISNSAQRGLKLFVGVGQCRLCHHGPNLTDGEFHDIFLPSQGGGTLRPAARQAGVRAVKLDPFNSLGSYSDDRTGMVAQMLEFLAETPENRGRFKTPSLRNVAKTQPYMHAGQKASLTDVISYYSTLTGAVHAGHGHEAILVPLHLSPGEMRDLVAFLESLTDDTIDEELMKQPESPLHQ